MTTMKKIVIFLMVAVMATSTPVYANAEREIAETDVFTGAGGFTMMVQTASGEDISIHLYHVDGVKVAEICDLSSVADDGTCETQLLSYVTAIRQTTEGIRIVWNDKGDEAPLSDMTILGASLVEVIPD